MSGSGRPAVFLDRDGTLITETGYLADPAALRLYPGAAAAVRSLNELGLPVVVVTNQSGVARGLFDEERLAAVHRRLREELEAGGARLDSILYCPHHPEIGESPYRTDCDCRKPSPGLFVRAASELGVDLAASWAVGDAARDLEAARAAGVERRVLVATGKGRDAWAGLDAVERAECLFVDDLTRAAEAIAAAQGR